MESGPIQTVKVGAALVVRFSGDQDNDLRSLTADFVRRMVAVGEKRIVLDMERVRKFASSAINNLVRILRAVQDEGGELSLVNVPADIMKILSMINIIGKFTVYSTLDDLKAAMDPRKTKGHEIVPITPLLSLSKKIQGDTHTIAITGPFVEGINRAVLIEETISSLKAGAGTLVLDFAETTVIDTVSVGILLTIHRMCGENESKLVALNMNDILMHVLRVNGVEGLFTQGKEE